ncbi:MAG: ParA family protein [Zetaproteobacteria bacterium]|nr:ParA family protein [Zetaproteobacteria bacterium]
MRRVVFNQKGGVGKTSITCNLAATFAEQGKKTLVIDLDAQGNTTHYLLGGAPSEPGKSITHFFEETLRFKFVNPKLDPLVRETPYPHLHVIAADQGLIDLQGRLETRYKILKLKQAVEVLCNEFDYDHVLFDPPPALNFFSMSALLAADRILIPFDCDTFSGQALLQVIELVQEIQSDHDCALKVEGAVVNHFQKQARLPQSAVDEVIASGIHVFEPYLSSSVALKESHRRCKPLVYSHSSHKLTEQFRQLSLSIEERLQAEVKSLRPRKKRTKAKDAEI